MSHSFRVGVEAHFYKYVAIPEKRLLYFCRTMIARPDLAGRVHRLAFTGAVHREPEPGDTDVVAQMMKLLVNLKDLSISSSFYPRQAGEHPWPVCHDDVRILHDCPFKLERLACIFTWAEPLVQWLSTQPQLATFEHDDYPSGEVRLGASDATLMSCSYLRISPYILSCYDGREKPQPVVLRFDMWLNTVQEEFRAARSLCNISRNLKCLTLTRHTLKEEYLSTSRILRTFADTAPNLTCLAIYEDIDYVRILPAGLSTRRNRFAHEVARCCLYIYIQSAGENKRILRIIKENFMKLQVFVWAPLNYPVTQDEDGFTSSSSGFSIDSCTEEEMYSFDKTERYALAMFDAVPALRMFISFRKGPCHVWRRGPVPQDPGEPRPFKRTPISICPSEDTFRAVDPDHPIDLFVTNVPHGPPLAEPRVIRIYNAPTSLPVSRSSRAFQNL